MAPTATMKVDVQPTPELLEISRDPLRQWRDVLACVFYALGSLVLVGLIGVAVWVAVSVSLSDLGADTAPAPDGYPGAVCPVSDYC